jgi:hypothetical protein
MNIPRIIVAGLAAGLVMNVGDFITGAFLMADEMRAMMSRLGLDAAAMETPEGIIPWVIVDFLYGILIVFTYAAIRPRFGPGPKTAILAGFLLYATVTIVLYGFMTMGIFDPEVFVKSAAFALVNTIFASLVGGLLYREQS